MAKGNKSKTTESTAPKAEDPSATSPVTGIDQATTNGTHEPKGGAAAYTREIEKRLAKWSKKKRGIDTIEAKITGLTDQEREITKLINNDEKKKLQEKPQVEERVKEYQELTASLNAALAEDQKIKAAEKEAYEAEFAGKLEKARKEGFEEGQKAQKEVLLTCFRFLRLAGYRRAMPDENQEENEAIEKVLIMVYSSEDSATAAIESLAASKDEPVEGETGVTYARIKEIAETLYAGEEEHVEPVEEPTATQSSELGESTVLVTPADAESTPVETAPPQTLTTTVGESQVAPANASVDDGAANAAAVEPVEGSEDWNKVNAGGKSADNGAVANSAPTISWADQSQDEATKAQAPATPAEEAFQEVTGRNTNRGRGFRGRGEFRGNFRGGPRGGFRGRGDGYRGRGEFRGGDRGYRGRGDRPFRPRGDRQSQDTTSHAAPAAEAQ